MILCAKCHKRPAVVFVTRIDQNNQSVNEGICLKCAKELGIKPIDDILNKMGISEEEIENMDMALEALGEDANLMNEGEDDDPQTRAPSIDFKKLFGGMPISGPFPGPVPGQNPSQNNGANQQDGKHKTKNKEKSKKFLTQYCKNLTDIAKKGELDRVIGRERELSRVIQILCRRQKNNPCLIGEPGVGKTAIAEALAQALIKEDAPFKLHDKEIHLLDLTSLVAGTQFRGQFESRMKGLIEEIKSLGNIILVIDEVHNIVGAGDAEGSMNAANILKPALSRGEIQVIGATTLTEYRKYIEKDAALERRFQSVFVDEPSVEESVEILMGIKSYYEKFHGITIPDETVKRAVILSERYITDRFLPDKAIDLIDEASSRLALDSPIISRIDALAASLEATRKEKSSLESEIEENKEGVVSDDKYARLAELKVREIKDLEEFNSLSCERDTITLTQNELAAVIEIWTGVPATNITENEFKRLDGLEARLKARIIGQDEALTSVVKAIKRNRAGVSYKRRPVSFIFAGPTGVGKTELVKTLASDLFDSPETLIRLDMSEFMEKHSVSRIIGAPPGYVGYDEAGQLTEKIRRKPYSVILFDEIEKAHPDVLNILLQVLDDGRITDAHGKTVNFENTVIVMTTNAGSDVSSSVMGFTEGTAGASGNSKTEKALSGFLRPEFINRIDEIITFRQLDKDDFTKIAVIMLDELKSALEEKSISLTYSQDVAQIIAEKSFSLKYGARNMRRFIRSAIEDVIANKIINDYERKVSAISIGVTDGDIDIAAI